jgi:hypothetical protein
LLVKTLTNNDSPPKNFFNSPEMKPPENTGHSSRLSGEAITRIQGDKNRGKGWFVTNFVLHR